MSKKVQDEKKFIAVGELLDGRWEIVRVLGEGGFGAVYEVKGIEGEHRDQHYALKVEAKDIPDYMKLLAMERDVLRALRDISAKHFCRYITVGQTDRFRFLIMSLIGKSLDDLKRAVGVGTGRSKQFSLCTSLFVGIETLESIQELHKIGYLHRDLKPANFAVGREPDTHRIYMLDFGMCRKYRKDDGSHRRPRDRLGFRGTVRYASPACHKEEELSRRDDLWSWLFMIVDVSVGKLPWDSLQFTRGTSQTEMMTKIGESKDASLAQNGRILLEGCPREYQSAYDHTMTLQYADEPNYDLIKRGWMACQQRKGYSVDSPLDWEPKGEHFKEAQAVPHATMMVDDRDREEMLKKSFEDKQKK